MSINANEHFEIVGELYERRFHKLRPGKSVSPHAGYSSSDPENVEQFKRWIDAQSWDDAIAEISRLQHLLTWAMEFVDRETDCLEESHKDGDGNIDDANAAQDINDAREWLKKAAK